MQVQIESNPEWRAEDKFSKRRVQHLVADPWLPCHRAEYELHVLGEYCVVHASGREAPGAHELKRERCFGPAANREKRHEFSVN